MWVAELIRKRYPGARVDSETPFYQLNIPEVYKSWSFSKRFPDHIELREYFAHIDKTLDLRKDVTFNSKVDSCTWHNDTSKWSVTTETGVKANAQFLVTATGLLHKPHLPSWEGQEIFKGAIYHSASWPSCSDLTGKKVAIIGAGATAVQIVQEVGKQASHLAHFIRRPSHCLPMGQRAWTVEEQRVWKAFFPSLFATGRNSHTGFPIERRDQRVQDVSPEEREAYFEHIWATGAFHFSMLNFNNVSTDREANLIVYDFWKRKVRERLTDSKKQRLMAPDEATYYFATKRTPLEHDYYEVLNQDNVEIVDLNKHPITAFTERGMRLEGEECERDFDVIVCATGFDSFTGSLTNMGLRNKNGVDIKDVWKEGVRTYLGITMNGFPNAFMVYSPQAPTALANGPTIIGMQSRFAVNVSLDVADIGELLTLSRMPVRPRGPSHCLPAQGRQDDH
jgi:cation diffusion facilitator CzcD-associated flavoprotein CzcO